MLYLPQAAFAGDDHYDIISAYQKSMRDSDPNHYVKQQYLPDDIKTKRYYDYGDNKTEQAFKTYWDKIKK